MHIHLCDCLPSFTFDMTSLCSWVIQTNCAWWNSGANSGSMSLHFWATFEYHIALINAQFSVNKFVGRFGRLDLVRWTPAKKIKICVLLSKSSLYFLACSKKRNRQTITIIYNHIFTIVIKHHITTITMRTNRCVSKKNHVSSLSQIHCRYPPIDIDPGK